MNRSRLHRPRQHGAAHGVESCAQGLRPLVVHDVERRRRSARSRRSARTAAAERRGRRRRAATSSSRCCRRPPSSRRSSAARTASSRTRARATVIVDMSTIDPLRDRSAGRRGGREGHRVRRRAGRPPGEPRRARRVAVHGRRRRRDVFARVKPLLEAMGTTIHHCGGVGTGMRTKLVNNYLAIISCQLNAEAHRAVAALRPHAREDARRDPRHDGDQRPAQDRLAGEGAEGRHRARLHDRSRAQGPDAHRRRRQRREGAGADRRRRARGVQRGAQPRARRARIFRRWSTCCATADRARHRRRAATGLVKLKGQT